jgi:hypothetical protein
MSSKPSLTNAQQADVSLAEQFLAASAAGRPALGEFLHMDPHGPGPGLDAFARGYATQTVAHLLEIIADLTGQAS